MSGGSQRAFALTGGRTMDGARGDSALWQDAQAGRTVLFVEDEVLVRMAVADELRKAGFTVIEAANPDQALDVLTYAFDVKLVLSDIQMPGSMDGLALARLVRAAYPAIKIVLISGRSMVGVRAECDAFFAKPCNSAMMIRYIKSLLD
ncbi:MAG TPA: response regulator [Xanthobacteraceae bacterium]|nr:response regulator [Xanthobacteraceae bacterium]